MLVFNEISHRTVANRMEDRVETFLLDAVEADGPIQLSFRIYILFEADRKVGPEFRFVTLGVERRTTAFRDASVISAPSSLKTK